MLARVSAAGRDRYIVDDGLQHQAERALQVAIQVCLDIGAHLVAALALKAPDDYRGVFDRLAVDAGLDRALAERLKDAVGQRNLLVHAYVDVDPELMWMKLAEVDDLRAFAHWASERARA